MVKNLPANAGDAGSIPGLGRSLGEGNGNPPQYSCLENPMYRGAWWATIHRVTKNETRLKLLSSCMEEPMQYNDSQVSGSPPWEVWDFMIAGVFPAYLSYCGYFFMSFSYRRSFLVGLSPFHCWMFYTMLFILVFL